MFKKNDMKINDKNYIDELIDNGKAFYELGKYQEALEVYDKILEIDPENADVLFEKGYTLYTLYDSYDYNFESVSHELYKYQDVIEIYNQALEIDPENITILNCKGLALEKICKYKESVKAYKQALEIDSENEVVQKNKEIALDGLEDLKIYPQYVDALHNKAITLLKIGECQKAKDAFHEVADNAPEDVGKASFRIFVWFMMDGKKDFSIRLVKDIKSLRDYDELLKIPSRKKYELNEGGVRGDRGIEYGKSLKICNELLEINPRDIDALTNKGLALYNLLDYREAIDVYDELLEINPIDIVILNNKGIALCELDEYQEALDILDELLEIDPKNVAALNNKGVAFYELGEYQEALEVFDKASKIRPQNTVTLKNKNESDIDQQVISTTQTESNETYLFFDTETTGLPHDWNASVNDVDNWPRIVQISWVVYKNGTKISSSDFIIKPEGFKIPIESSNVHGITTECAEKEGVSLQAVLTEFKDLVEQADLIIAHNISFDEKIVGAEFIRKNMSDILKSKRTICTMKKSTEFCAIPSSNGYNDYKWPKLSELYIKLFDTEFEDAHNSLADVNATAKCFWEMKKRGIL